MLNNFRFFNPTKIYFGKDCLEDLANEIKNTKRILMLYEGEILKKIGVYNKVVNELQKSNVEFIEYTGVTPNPESDFCKKIAKLANDKNVDMILSVGGGSVIDAGKAIALLATNPDDDIFEYIDCIKKPVNKPIKLGVVLTSAATSSENSPALVISDNLKNRKETFFSEDIFPVFAFCDPTFTFTLPKFQTAAGAFDVYSHIIEQFLSLESFDASELPHLNIVKTLVKWVPIALKTPNNLEARANIMWSSTLALNGHGYVGKNPGWYAHGLSYPITTYFKIPHGAALAITLPSFIEYQLKNGNNIEKFIEKMKVVSKLTFGHENINKYIKDLKKMINDWGLKSNINDYKLPKIDNKVLEKLAKEGFLGHSNSSFIEPNRENAKQLYIRIFNG